MFLSRMSQKEKLGIFLAGIVVFLALLDRMIIAPISGRLQEIRSQAKISEKQLSISMRNISQKESIAREYQKYAKYLKNFGSEEEQAAVMLSEIEDLARRSDMNLVDMKPQQPKKIDFYKEYNIEIEAEGEMEHIMNFFWKLNSSPQLLRVERLRLNLKKKGSPIVKASIFITKFSIS